MSLKGRDFLTLKDFSKEEIEEFLDLAAELKAKKKKGIFDRMYTGKNVALIFEKTSTRTRCRNDRQRRYGGVQHCGIQGKRKCHGRGPAED